MLRNSGPTLRHILKLPMERKSGAGQLHFDNRFMVRDNVSDNRMQNLAWQGRRQSRAGLERTVQMKAGRRIIPVCDICPIVPGKLSRYIAINGMLKLPAGFGVLRHQTAIFLGS